jgi:hypothetical protein
MHDNLAVTYGIRDKERIRVMHIVQGIAPYGRTLRVNDSSIHTLKAGLLERLFYCVVDGKFVQPPRVSSRHVFDTLHGFRRSVIRKFGLRPTPVSPAQFVQMYKGRARARYENAADDYHKYGVTRADSISTVFSKMEKVNPSKAPRNINPRTPVYNLAVGVYLKPIEHAMYRAIARASGSSMPVVMKGFNVVEVGTIIREKWDQFADPVCIGLDATKFDMHVSAAMLKWEHSVYLELYNEDKELAKLLKWQVANKGRGFAHDGKLKFSIYGSRFSGDMNTAMGNCLIMCACVITYAKSKNIPCELANNGDDCVVIMDKKNLGTFSNGLSEWFLALGFRMTVEPPVDTFERIEFCQMHPVFNGLHWTMVRDHNKSREKDSIALLDISTEGAYGKWMSAVGECGLALNSGIPVLQSMYVAFNRHGKPGKVANSMQMQSGAMFLRRGLVAKYQKVQDVARVSYYKAFDVTPDEQIALEEYYNDLNLEFAGVETYDILEQINSSPL